MKVKVVAHCRYAKKVLLLKKHLKEKQLEIDRLSDLLNINKEYPPHIAVSMEGTEVYEEMQKIMTDLLNGKIRLCDVPFEKRILSYAPYFMAFRYSRAILKELCIEDLDVLREDVRMSVGILCGIDKNFLEDREKDIFNYFKYSQVSLI